MKRLVCGSLMGVLWVALSAFAEEPQSTRPVVSGKDIKVTIQNKEGWKVNSLAPSWLKLDRKKKGSQAYDAMISYDKAALLGDNVVLSGLAEGEAYRLRGRIYTCESKHPKLCTLKTVEQKLEVTNNVPRTIQNEAIVLDLTR